MKVRSPNQIFDAYRSLRRLFRRVPIRPGLLWLSIGSILCASIAQMLGLGLIVPILNGLFQGNFESLLKMRGLGFILRHLPFEATNGNIFSAVMSLILLAVYIENIALFAGRMFSSVIQTDLTSSLQCKVFQRLLNFDKSFYDREKTGKLNSIITTVIPEVGHVLNSLVSLTISLSMACTFFVMMLLMSIPITILSMVLLPIIHFVTTSLGTRANVTARGRLERSLALSSLASDVMTNIPLVQISGMEDGELEKFRRTSDDLRRHQVSFSKKAFLTPRLVDVINSTGVILVVCAGVAIFFNSASGSAGSLLVYFVCLRRFTGQLQQISETWIGVLGYLPSVERALWVFEDGAGNTIHSGTVFFTGLSDQITFNKVCFGYEARNYLLKNLSFGVKRGEMLALVGPSGAGKTSLINLLPRFHEYQAGSIEIDGINIRDFELKSLRKRMALVSQSAFVMNDTILHNLTYGLDPASLSEERIFQALEKAHLADFVLSLPEKEKTLVGPQGVRLSGGERQRLSIARCILRDPDILILDEATSALDSETEHSVQEGIEQLIGGRTIIVIAHRLSTVRNADHILVLENGEITERGTHTELLAQQGRFYRFATLQNGLS